MEVRPMNNNIHRIIVFRTMALFLFLFPGLPFPFTASCQVRVEIPATRLSIIPPDCYKFLPAASALYCGKLNITISFFETPAAAAELYPRYSDPENLAQLDFEEISRPEPIIIDSLPGFRFNIRQQSGILDPHNTIHRVFICGDSSEAFNVIISYPDSVPAADVEPLIAATSTIEWNRTRTVSPLERLACAFSGPAGFIVADNDPVYQIYLPEGGLPSGSASKQEIVLKVIDNSIPIEFLPDTERRKILESYISRSFFDIKISRVIEFESRFIDGLSAYESVSSGLSREGKGTALVYFTLIFHPAGFITFAGRTSMEGSDRFIAVCKASARSIHKLHIGVPPESPCTPLLESKSYREAGDCFAGELARDTNSLGYRRGLAVSLNLQGNHEDAIREFTRIIEKFPFSPEVFAGRAESYISLRRNDEAIRDLTNAIQLEANDIDLLLRRARLRLQQHAPGMAADDVKRAIALAPDSALLYGLLGDTQSGDEAIGSYTTAIKLDPADFAALLGRGRQHLITGRFQQALKDLDAAHRIKPDNKSVHELRANAYLSMGRVPEALKDLTSAPEDAEVLSLRGFLLGMSGNVADGLKFLDRAVNMDSTSWRSYFSRGTVFFLDGSYQEAVRDFRKAAGYSPSAENRAWLYFGEGLAYGWDYARRNLERYVASTADNAEDWKQILAYLLGSITEDRLIRSIKPFQLKEASRTETRRLDEARCDTYFAIAMKKFATGLKVGAKPFWKHCLESNYKSLHSYIVANAILNGGWVK